MDRINEDMKLQAAALASHHPSILSQPFLEVDQRGVLPINAQTLLTCMKQMHDICPRQEKKPNSIEPPQQDTPTRALQLLPKESLS